MSALRDLQARGAHLVEIAENDPQWTIAEGQRLLDCAEAKQDDAAAAVVLRAVGNAHRYIGEIDAAVVVLDAAVEAATRAGDDALVAVVRTSRGAARFLAGAVNDAMDDLDEAVAMSTAEARGFPLFQRGTVLWRLGRNDRARQDFALALPLLQRAGQRKFEAHLLSNRGLLHTEFGALAAADEDFDAALVLYEELSMGAEYAVTLHNRGLVASRRGDLVRALQIFDECERQMSATGVRRPDLAVDYCEALLAAGLPEEARTRAARSVNELMQAGDLADAAETRMYLAVANHRSGRVREAIAELRTAREEFEAQKRQVWAAMAEVLELRLALDAGGSSASIIDRLDRVAARLTRLGAAPPALEARLLAADAALRLQRGPLARRRLARLESQLANAPVEARLAHLAIDADTRLAAKDYRGADARVDEALILLEQHRATFGAADFRASIATHASRIFRIGRSLAASSGDPERIFDRTEATSAGALRLPTVRPAPDERVATDLAELRRVVAELRETTGAPARPLEQRRRRLEEAIADAARRRPGAGPPRPATTLDEARAALGDWTMSMLVEVDGVLLRLDIDQGGVTVSSRGPLRQPLALAEAIRFALERIVRVTTTAPSRDRALSFTREQLSVLDRIVLSPDDRPVVLVVPAVMRDLPWGALPSLRYRPFVVTPSASHWVATSRTATNLHAVTLLSGPTLVHASAEAERLAAVWGARVAHQGAAPVSTALAAICAADLAHVAAHHHPRRGNPLFSALELADGPLYLHDLDQLTSVPGIVMLSACESAWGAARPGDEHLGLTTALLSLGVRCVIAATAPIPDDERTIDAVARVHEHLAMSLRPAAALALTRTAYSGGVDEFDVSCLFTCFGSS